MNVPCSGGSKPPPYGANRRTSHAVEREHIELLSKGKDIRGRFPSESICIVRLNLIKINLMQTAPCKQGVRVTF